MAGMGFSNIGSKIDKMFIIKGTDSQPASQQSPAAEGEVKVKKTSRFNGIKLGGLINRGEGRAAKNQPAASLSEASNSQRSLAGIGDASVDSNQTPRMSNKEGEPKTNRQVWKDAVNVAKQTKAEKKALRKELASLTKQLGDIAAPSTGFASKFKLSKGKPQGEGLAEGQLHARHLEVGQAITELKAQRKDQNTAIQNANKALWKGRRDDFKQGVKDTGSAIAKGAKDTGSATVKVAKYAGAELSVPFVVAGGGLAAGSMAAYNGAGIAAGKIGEAGVASGRFVKNNATAAIDGMRTRIKTYNDNRPINLLKAQNTMQQGKIDTLEQKLDQLTRLLAEQAAASENRAAI